jgi:hypothetical protein
MTPAWFELLDKIEALGDERALAIAEHASEIENELRARIYALENPPGKCYCNVLWTMPCSVCRMQREGRNL